MGKYGEIICYCRDTKFVKFVYFLLPWKVIKLREALLLLLVMGTFFMTDFGEYPWNAHFPDILGLEAIFCKLLMNVFRNENLSICPWGNSLQGFRESVHCLAVVCPGYRISHCPPVLLLFTCIPYHLSLSHQWAGLHHTSPCDWSVLLVLPRSITSAPGDPRHSHVGSQPPVTSHLVLITSLLITVISDAQLLVWRVFGVFKRLALSTPVGRIQQTSLFSVV